MYGENAFFMKIKGAQTGWFSEEIYIFRVVITFAFRWKEARLPSAPP